MLVVTPFNGRRPRPLPHFNGRVRRRALAPETAALVARMTTPPSAERAARIDGLIAALKGAGIWDKLAILHVHAAHDAQAAGLNWLAATFTATPATTTPGTTPLPAFTADRGFQGDGAAGFLDLGAGYASVPLVATGDHGELVWSLTDLASTGRDVGAAGNASTFVVGLSAGNMIVRANSGASLSTPVASSLGLYGFSRSGSAVDLVRNGAVLATLTDAATGFATGNLSTLRGSSTFSARQVAARVVSRALTASEGAALHAALRSYLQSVGAVAP